MAQAATRTPHATAEAVYELHADGLRNRCLQLTRDPARAEDLMQEVFTRFLARFPHPPPDMNVHAYLLTMARNVWINQARAERAAPVEQIDEALTPDDRIENDPVRSLLLAEQRTHVHSSAAALPERQRRALALRELEGRSYAEIGADLDLGSNAVAQIVWRARTQLRRSFRRSQVDLDRIPAECRALLDEMSDLVDNVRSDGAAELEAHVADCQTCRTTLASYQEAGSSFRGAVPFLPILAAMTRLGTLVRTSVEAPMGIGTAAAVTAAVVATAGGGGAIVAHSVAASSGTTPSRSTRAFDRTAGARGTSPSLAVSLPAATPTSPPHRAGGRRVVVRHRPTHGTATHRRRGTPTRAPAPSVPPPVAAIPPASPPPAVDPPDGAPSPTTPPPDATVTTPASTIPPGTANEQPPETASGKTKAPHTPSTTPARRGPKASPGTDTQQLPATPSTKSEKPASPEHPSGKAVGHHRAPSASGPADPASADSATATPAAVDVAATPGSAVAAKKHGGADPGTHGKPSKNTDATDAAQAVAPAPEDPGSVVTAPVGVPASSPATADASTATVEDATAADLVSPGAPATTTAGDAPVATDPPVPAAASPSQPGNAGHRGSAKHP